MPRELRGQNIRCEVQADGTLYLEASLNTDGTLAYNIELDQREYHGRKSPVMRSIWNGVTLTLNSEPQSSDFFILKELQKAKAQGDSDALQKVINAFCEVDFGDGDLVTVMLPDAVMHSPSLSLPSRTEVSQLSTTFSAGEAVRI